MKKLNVLFVVAGMMLLSIVANGQSVGTSNETDEESIMRDKTEIATFGGGCFWCTEAVYEKIDGVVSVISGYAGGKTKDPTYEDVLTGRTGHAEVIQIEYDPGKVDYDEFLDLFWKAHDPTTLNRQGADVGTQYRSIILYQNNMQKEAAERSLKKASSLFENPIVTEIKSLENFYPAEDYHQDY